MCIRDRTVGWEEDKTLLAISFVFAFTHCAFYMVRIWEQTSEKKMCIRDRMAGYGITPVDVKNAITNENIELPSRSIEDNTVELTLRTLGQIHTAKEFNNIILKEVGGRVVGFSDIGYAELGPADIKRYMKMNGRCV